MFVSDKIVYLQMQKTASTHIARVLDAVVGGEQHVQHQRLKIDPAGRLVVASIRDPWAWYVSLWSYGCREGGGVSGIYHRLTAPPPTFGELASRAFADARAKRHLPIEEIRTVWAERARQRSTRTDLWRPVYTHPDDVDAFRAWLRLMFDPERAHELLAPYGRTPLRFHGGFMSFRYFWLLARDRGELEQAGMVDSPDAIREFDRTRTVHDDMIRIEELESELRRVLDRAGYELTPEQDAVLHERCRQKSNVSPHLGVAEYYDDESLELVATRERVLIERYGYQVPRAAR
jgi:hypothetical protein